MLSARTFRNARYWVFCSVGLLFLTGFVAGAGSDAPPAGIAAPGGAGVDPDEPVAWTDTVFSEAQPPGNVPKVPRDGNPPDTDPYGIICCMDVTGCYARQGSTCPPGMMEVDCPCPPQ